MNITKQDTFHYAFRNMPAGEQQRFTIEDSMLARRYEDIMRTNSKKRVEQVFSDAIQEAISKLDPDDPDNFEPEE